MRSALLVPTIVLFSAALAAGQQPLAGRRYIGAMVGATLGWALTRHAAHVPLYGAVAR